jgi:hypothetical protein
MHEQDANTLTTLTVTKAERVILARGLTVSAALLEALGDDARAIMQLWERVQPDEMDV